MQIHFKSDVFATVAITAAKSSYCVPWAAVNEMNASKEISLKHLKCDITTQAKGNFRGKENFNFTQASEMWYNNTSKRQLQGEGEF